MVVTRRQSASNIPAVASRTSSSSGSSRTSKTRGTDKNSPLKESDLSPTNVPPNGTPSKPPPVGPRHLEEITFDDDSQYIPLKSTPTKTSIKSKSKSKAAKKSSKLKKRRMDKGISAFDIIARLFLLWLTIYTLSVCPEDTELRSPICRALTEYRRVILEPYIYPPIRAALDHPAVAPHIQRAQPYYTRAVQFTTPLVRRGKHEWRNKVVPRMQWFQLRVQPYVSRVQRQYDLTVGPYVRQATKTTLRYRLLVEPYLLAAAVKSHRSWETAKPYLGPVWREAKRVPWIVAVYVGGPLGRARRQWVDPQVIKIWDAVVEQGKANTPVVQSANTKSASYTPTSSIPVSSIVSGTQVDTSALASEDFPPAASIGSESLPTIPVSTDEASASASSIMVKSASVTIPSTISSSSFVDHGPSPSSESASFVTPSTSDQTAEAAVSASHLSSDIHIKTSFGLSGTSSSGTDDEDEDIGDLEHFLSELDANSTLELVEEPPAPPEREETEEEREERLRLAKIETAKIRADIEARHTKWEVDLEKFAAERRKIVIAALKRLRDAASEEARAPNGPVRAPIEALVQEAERSLKSLKAYSRKLATENKLDQEKIKQWETVIDKVDKKFGERVDSTAEAVRKWWDVQTEQENHEIAFYSRQVTQLASKAQENLGFDYAWLDDVTYDDWQRFHKLYDDAKAIAQMFTGMQNGSVPNAPANPVSDIMEAIQEEVDDVILGFETNLGRVKSAGIDSFAATKSEAPAASSAKSVPSGEESSTVVHSSVPEVSIPPINPSDMKAKAGVPPVILSRGAEEVESAVSKAEEAKTKAAHTEL